MNILLYRKFYIKKTHKTRHMQNNHTGLLSHIMHKNKVKMN